MEIGFVFEAGADSNTTQYCVPIKYPYTQKIEVFLSLN